MEQTVDVPVPQAMKGRHRHRDETSSFWTSSGLHSFSDRMGAGFGASRPSGPTGLAYIHMGRFPSCIWSSWILATTRPQLLIVKRLGHTTIAHWSSSDVAQPVVRARHGPYQDGPTCASEESDMKRWGTSRSLANSWLKPDMPLLLSGIYPTLRLGACCQ